MKNYKLHSENKFEIQQNLKKICNNPTEIQDYSSRIVNNLLANSLDEEFPEIFELATNLELPIGFNYKDQVETNEAFEKLKKLIKENNLC